jgi:hypothetical protein
MGRHPPNVSEEEIWRGSYCRPSTQGARARARPSALVPFAKKSPFWHERMSRDFDGGYACQRTDEDARASNGGGGEAIRLPNGKLGD